MLLPKVKENDGVVQKTDAVNFCRIAVENIDQQIDLPKDIQALYSRMKYGDPIAVKQWASMLKLIMLAHPVIVEEVKNNRPIILTSSAYGAVRTASNAVMKQLAKLLREEGIAFETTKITREGDFTLTHYGSMNLVERLMRIGSRKVSISSHSRRKVEDKVVVIVDDLRATGSHEQTLLDLFSTTGAKHCCFAYLICFSNLMAQMSPEVEEHLNSAHVQGVFDLLPFYQDASDDLELNARTVKFILTTDATATKDQAEMLEDLYSFLHALEDRVLLKLYKAVTSKDGYYKHYRFLYGLHALNNVVIARRIVPIADVQDLKKTVVLHNVTVDDAGNLKDMENGKDLNFLGEYYSQMKLGSWVHITWFGEQIANRVITQLAEGSGPLKGILLRAKRNKEHVVMVSPGSRNVESAQNFIFEIAVKRINTWLALQNLPTIILMKMSRLGSGGANYSELTASERLRQKLKTRTVRSLMPADDLFAAGTHVIFADDARVTGASADRIEMYSLEKGAKSFSSIYCITVDTLVTLANPAIEHVLNHFYVKDVLDERVVHILAHEDFRPVQRMIRLLFKEGNRAGLGEFLPRVRAESLLKIYAAALSNDYLSNDKYRDSVFILKNELQNRGLLDRSGLPFVTALTSEVLKI